VRLEPVRANSVDPDAEQAAWSNPVKHVRQEPMRLLLATVLEHLDGDHERIGLAVRKSRKVADNQAILTYGNPLSQLGDRRCRDV
jgi:hypothetical protein